MNIRSLTRGDGVVIGAAVLLFIASFLEFTSFDCPSSGGCPSVDLPNAWDNLGLLMSMFLSGVIGAALIVVSRAMPGRKIVGIDLGQFGVAFSIFAAWTAFWTVIGMDPDAGAGAIVGLLAALVLAAGVIAAPLVSALKAPLMGAPRPAAPQPYGAQPGGAPGGYGYPGGQQPYGAQQPGQPQPYGAQPQAADAQAQAQQTSGGGDFTPFWFAVPVARPLYGEDGSPTPIAELAPGTWYLAVEQRGPGLVAQTQDGRRGVLQDTTGIQRG
ncbi:MULTISPECIES: DUF5336 domain-containing protein [Streptomyces]|uniref:DUF5336 domain-containing protein n=1 Tax=Streptomyces chengmaiensis TaxID=3040919 RepID=A0ABT6HWT6_9ACTN|nr:MULTISPECIES: DUF5336 domain-containing protein [Streptomyces]MDH2393163.1 DUF5336 domain-containing protein [Streptomyces chengmaiensis]WRQ79204.1 DUF5336 domain-containing protein [Streptomyces sp. MUM 178J]